MAIHMLITAAAYGFATFTQDELRDAWPNIEVNVWEEFGGGWKLGTDCDRVLYSL